MDLYNFSEIKLLAFILILMRVSAFLIAWPVFSITSVPMQMKIFLGITLSFVLFPLVGWEQVVSQMMTNQIIWLVIREVFIGLCIGYIGKFFFFVISSSGEMISLAMGLGNAQIFNPNVDLRGNAVEQFQIAIATLIFLILNGHHMLLSALVQSYKLIPLSSVGLNIEVFKGITFLGQVILEIGFKLAAPVLIAILIMNISMGFIGRVVPQINVLVTSFPLNILLGFFILIVSFPMFIGQLNIILDDMVYQLFLIIKAW